MVDGLGMARSQLEQHVICEALALRLEVRGLCERELVILFLYDFGKTVLGSFIRIRI
jgi:hypothetical protein